MKRRDLAVAFWALVGGYFLIRGGFEILSIWMIGLYRSHASVFEAGTVPDLSLLLMRSLPGLALVIAGQHLLRHRFDLGEWLFEPKRKDADDDGREPAAEEPAAAAAADDAADDAAAAGATTAAGATAAAEATATAKATIATPATAASAATVAAHTNGAIDADGAIDAPTGTADDLRTHLVFDLCALVIAWICVRVVSESVTSIEDWIARRGRAPYGTVEALLGILIVPALAIFVLTRRNRISSWILHQSPRGASQLQAAAFGLLGLFLILWALPSLLLAGIEIWQAGGNLGEADSRRLVLSGFAPAARVVIGAALLLGRQGLRSGWRRLRPMSADESDLEAVDPESFE